MAAILLSLLRSNVNTRGFLDGHNILYASCLFYALSFWSSLVYLFSSVSFSNYPEVSFENISLASPRVIRTNFSATILIRWNMAEEIKEERSRVKYSIPDEKETFFLLWAKKGKFFRRERNSRIGEFDKHQMKWDECIWGRQLIAVSLKHRLQQFTSVRELLPKDFHTRMKSGIS